MPRKPKHPAVEGTPLAAHRRADLRHLPVRWFGALSGPAQRALSSLALNFMLIGVQGCGKTLMIKHLLTSLLWQLDSRYPLNYRVLSLDAKLDLYPFFASDLGLAPSVILTSPFDQRSSAWDVAADCTSSVDAYALATTLVDSVDSGAPRESDPFWPQAARAVIAGVICGLQSAVPRDWDLRDLVLVCEDPDLLTETLERTPTGGTALRTFIQTESRLAASVSATISARLTPWRVIAALSDRAETSYSLRSWSTGSGILLVGSHFSNGSIMRVFNNVLLKRAIEVVLDRPGETDTDLTWFNLDELPQVAGCVPNLIDIFTLGRSKGARAINAGQSFSTYRAAFPSRELADQVIALSGNKCFLQLGSPEDAKEAETFFGSIKREDRSWQIPRDQQHEGSDSYHIREEPRVPAQKLLELKSASTTGGGLNAYFHSLGGVTSHCDVPGADVLRYLPRSSSSSSTAPFLERPKEQAELRPFNEADAKRLQLRTEASESIPTFRVPPPFQPIGANDDR